MKFSTTLTVMLTFFTSYLFSQNLAVYISDAANFNSGPWQIAKFTEDGVLDGTLISAADGIVWPQDIIFLESEEAVLISNLGPAGIISKHDWATGDFIENFAEGLGGPTRMKIGPDGLLYVIQWSNTANKVLRYELNGTFVDEFTDVGVIQSIGIDWDANGDLYISSYGSSSVRKFDGSTGDDLGLFIPNGLAGPTNIWFEDDGNLIILSYNSGTIKRYSSSGNFVEDIVAGLSGPEGFAFFPNGDILIGNGGDGSVKRYDSNFNFLGDFVSPGVLLTPNAIVIREDIPLSVEEKTAKTVFVSPSIGNSFNINTAVVSEYDELIINNISGKLIAVISIKDNILWDASQYPEGVYLITAYKNGQKETQKIIVKK